MRSAVLLILLASGLAGCLNGDPAPAPAPASVGPAELTASWSPQFPFIGEPVTFDVSVRSPVAGDRIERVVWQIGDDVIEQSSPSVTFDAAGDVPFVVQVRTNGTGLNQAEGVISVLRQGASPPVAGEEVPLRILSDIDGPTVTFAFAWGEAAELVNWDFGDGQSSSDLRPTHTYSADGTYLVTLRASSADSIETATASVVVAGVPARSHVIVGVPDSGINPYHEQFRRPDLTQHPCTYIPDFPCDVQELRLSLDAPDYGTARQLDEAVWDSVRPGEWYWIPGTAFVAVSCGTSGVTGICVLDDGTSHGTGTTSSVIMENPDTLLAFREGGPEIGAFRSKGIPVDIYSVSWGHIDPAGIGLTFGYPLPAGMCGRDDAPLYVKSAGNEPGPSTLLDCWSGDPDIISVGGAFAQDNSQYLASGKEMDVVSYYCRPTAQPNSMDGMRSSFCGTSFGAPTVAGALSKVVLAVREASGYTGTIEGNVLDPASGLTTGGLRAALNRTASYSPDGQYSNTNAASAPLNPLAPWTQWGWGFYDGLVADATTDHLLVSPAPAKDPAAVAYMDALYTARETLYG